MIDRIREAGEAFERKVEAHGMPPNCRRIKELEAEVTRLQAQLEGARAACQALRTGPARLVKEWRAQAAAEANPRVAVALDDCADELDSLGKES